MTSTGIGKLSRKARGASNSPWVNALARIGLAAKGASFVIVGLLAGKLAVGAGGTATSREGALNRLAREPFGETLLIALACGFAAYALWRFAQAFFDRENEGEGPKGLAKRATYFGRGVIYSALAWTAVQIVTEAHEPRSQNERAREATADVLGWPAGRWLVAGVGLCIAAVGIFNGYRGLTQSFEERLNTAEMSRTARDWVGRIGTIGMLARMVVFGLIGWFLVKAAVEYDAKDAIGLDGALQKLAHQTYGSWLLGVVAVGLVAYGIYGLVEARYRRV
jgi:uncharacterized protein DUF1206